MAQTIIHLQRLSLYGVAFHSYTEAHHAEQLVRKTDPRQLSRAASDQLRRVGCNPSRLILAEQLGRRIVGPALTRFDTNRVNAESA
jgi:hypothetical protein